MIYADCCYDFLFQSAELTPIAENCFLNNEFGIKLSTHSETPLRHWRFLFLFVSIIKTRLKRTSDNYKSTWCCLNRIYEGMFCRPIFFD